MSQSALPPLDTPCTPLWQQCGARMVSFASTNLPIQFTGSLSEHAAVRNAAGLFDVSHMGQIVIQGAGVVADLERLLPVDLTTMTVGRIRYSFLLNRRGGIIDDLMISRLDNGFLLVVNGSRRQAVLEHLTEQLDSNTLVRLRGDWALLALQGRDAVSVLQNVGLPVASLPFMHQKTMLFNGAQVRVSRCGYTGEDGFEVSIPAEHAMALAQQLLADPRVKPCGLAARDTLRLEAGLPLYGNDLSEDTTPIAAGLQRFMAKKRLHAADYMGAEAILPLLQQCPKRLVGLRPQGARPVRAGAALTNSAGDDIGCVTSGTFSPTLALPISMGYVQYPIPDQIFAGTTPVHVVPLPFVAHNYYKG